MKSNLKHRVIEHLERVQLDETRLHELEQLQRQPAAHNWWQNRALQVFAVACLVAAIAVSWLPGNPPDVLRAIAEEVAMNHLKHRPLEVRGASIAAVEDYFDELGFRLVDTLQPSGGIRLLGGRYCSLQGVTAAQLRQRDDQGHIQTLYQVPYEPARMGQLPDRARGEPPYSLQVRGLRVDLWVDRGVLFALAHE